MFRDKYQEDRRVPTIAVDLISESKGSHFTNIFDFGEGLLTTALEASDEIILKGTSGVIHVPIPIPKEFRTLDFTLSSEQIQQLYNIGYRAADLCLAENTQLRRFSDLPHGEAQQKNLVRKTPVDFSNTL
ncbi:MAG: hypothetical protein ACREYE_22820 [Gammaproteobacteria bacterium]